MCTAALASLWVLCISQFTSEGIISTCIYTCTYESNGDAHSCLTPVSLHIMEKAGLRQQQSDFHSQCLAVPNMFIACLTWEESTLSELRAILCLGAVLGALAQFEQHYSYSEQTAGFSFSMLSSSFTADIWFYLQNSHNMTYFLETSSNELPHAIYFLQKVFYSWNRSEIICCSSVFIQSSCCISMDGIQAVTCSPFLLIAESVCSIFRLNGSAHSRAAKTQTDRPGVQSDGSDLCVVCFWLCF